MGLSCEQITDLLPIWDGTNCSAAQERVGQLIEAKRAEIAERIDELQRFSAQLDAVSTALEAAPTPQACRTDLSCCVPEAGSERVPIELAPRRLDR
jgi:DNA-binding transcriptional MerR regulator